MNEAVVIGSYVAFVIVFGHVAWRLSVVAFPAVVERHGWRVWLNFHRRPALLSAAGIALMALCMTFVRGKWILWWATPYLTWIAPEADMKAVLEAWPGVVLPMTGSFIGLAMFAEGWGEMNDRPAYGRKLFAWALAGWAATTILLMVV